MTWVTSQCPPPLLPLAPCKGKLSSMDTPLACLSLLWQQLSFVVVFGSAANPMARPINIEQVAIPSCVCKFHLKCRDACSFENGPSAAFSTVHHQLTALPACPSQLFHVTPIHRSLAASCLVPAPPTHTVPLAAKYHVQHAADRRAWLAACVQGTCCSNDVTPTSACMIPRLLF